jgi:hypothetical protein
LLRLLNSVSSLQLLLYFFLQTLLASHFFALMFSGFLFSYILPFISKRQVEIEWMWMVEEEDKARAWETAMICSYNLSQRFFVNFQF